MCRERRPSLLSLSPYPPFSFLLSLTIISYVPSPLQPHCLGCGTTQCAACSKQIMKDGIQALDQSWHQKCFVCKKCKKDFSKDDGQFMVEGQSPICLKCSKKVNSSRGSEARKKQQCCHRCKKVLPPSSTMLIALERFYHRECFTCCKCRSLLEGNQFVALGNDPACPECAANQLAEKCSGCKLPITGTVVVALDRKWHPNCLLCINCNTPIINYGKVYRKGKNPCCPECLESVFRSRYVPLVPPRKFSGKQMVHSMETLLRHQESIDAFLKFLVRDYSVENLLFWMDVQQYQRLSSDHDLKIYSSSIGNKYIFPESELEVNIDSSTKSSILDNLSVPSLTLFDGACEQIVSLMRNNSFPRFLSSVECKDLLRRFS